MTELELKKLEDKIEKARKLSTNIRHLKTVVDMLKNVKDKPTVGITYVGTGLYVPTDRFLDLLEQSIKDYMSQLEKM